MKRKYVVLVLVTLLAIGVGFVYSKTSPPRDEVLVARFQKNKAVYEELRNRLREDGKLRLIAPWGFRTFESPLVLHPPTPELSVERYEGYLSLLATAGASGVSQSKGERPNICIFVWASGWAADTEHVAVCSLGVEPKDDGAASAASVSPGSRFKFTHIEGEWYLQKDS